MNCCSNYYVYLDYMLSVSHNYQILLTLERLYIKRRFIYWEIMFWNMDLLGHDSLKVMLILRAEITRVGSLICINDI